MHATPRRTLTGLVVLGLAVLAILQLIPFWLALSASTKPVTDTSSPLLPRLTDIEWSNFTDAVSGGGILVAIANTALVTVVATSVVCFAGAMTAYPLARRMSRLNKFVSMAILSLIMIPPLSILVPLYTLLTQIGAVNTYWGAILVMITMNLPLAVFLYTAFLRGVPGSLDEAAQLDGASTLQVFFRIIFPLLRPVTATVVILTSVAIWNDYALSNFILTRPENRMIAPAVGSFFAAQTNNLGAGAAGALIAAVPILLVYLVLQRHFINGMAAGAEK